MLPAGWSRNNAGISINLLLYPYYIADVANRERGVFAAVICNPARPSMLNSTGMFLQQVQQLDQRNKYQRIKVDGKTTINMLDIIMGPLAGSLFARAVNLLVAQEPMALSSSLSDKNFEVKWQTPAVLACQVRQRASDELNLPLDQWRLVASASALEDTVSINFPRLEAPGIVAHLILDLPEDIRLFVCVGYDLSLLRICTVCLCDEQFYRKGIKAWDIMRTYYDDIGGKERDEESLDPNSGLYSLRGLDDWTDFSLYEDTLTVTLHEGGVEVKMSPKFLEASSPWNDLSRRGELQEKLTYLFQ
jgi:hypothetical protein